MFIKCIFFLIPHVVVLLFARMNLGVIPLFLMMNILNFVVVTQLLLRQ